MVEIWPVMAAEMCNDRAAHHEMLDLPTVQGGNLARDKCVEMCVGRPVHKELLHQTTVDV